MSLKFGLPAALLLAASPIAAQPPAAAAPPAMTPAQTAAQAAIQRTATAFGQCISTAIQNSSAATTPEAAAAAALSGCAAQRAELGRSVDAMIATMPAAQQAEAHAAFESDMNRAQGDIAQAIAQQRAAAAAPAAPATPATPPH
jgi:hypothetical protein